MFVQSSCELLAFILYLCSLKQRLDGMDNTPLGCELLAFILYLCSLKQHDMYKTKSYNNLEVVSEKKNPALSSGIFLCFDRFFQFQNSSNCWHGVSTVFGLQLLKISMSPNCLSVIHKMPMSPNSGMNDFTRLICTSAFS